MIEVMPFSHFNDQNELIIHEHKLTDLIERLTFVQAFFYTWTKRLPSEAEEKILNACLVAMIDHGDETPSTIALNKAKDSGVSTREALSAAVLAMDEKHGATALQLAGELFSKTDKSAREVVIEALKSGDRLPGFGHRIYKEKDPRAVQLLSKAEQLQLADKYVTFALEIEKELAAQKGKSLPINVDGAIAAIACDLGVEPTLLPGLFVLSRVVGLMMHLKK